MQMMFMWLELEEKEKEKALKVSWAVAMYSVATAVERLERKMTASPPPRLPFRGKNLMEKPEGVKSYVRLRSLLTRSP